MKTSPVETGHVMKALAGLGQKPDDDLAPAEIALLLGGLAHKGLVLERYYIHLQKLADDVADRYYELLAAGAENTPETRLAALKHVFVDKYGYEGDADPDHIQNADLIRVIDRRKGNPVSLALLYIHAGTAAGWQIEGLDLPGYFALRLEHQGQRLIFDPYKGCVLLQAPDLRQLVKKTLGPHAELSADYFTPVTNREILIRLQNQVKLRQIESEDYEAALQSVEAMRAFAPEEFRLLLDAGVLYARTHQPQAAAEVLESYLGKAPPGQDRQEAAYLLEEVRLVLKE